MLFYATLGNHDNQNNRFYKRFNMGGERYFTFVKKNVRFFVLDTNQLDPKQRAWLDEALQRSDDHVADLLLPSPALLRRRSPRIRCVAARRTRTAPGQVRRQRRVLRTRPHLRAVQAAEGHHVLRLRVGWTSCAGETCGRQG